MTRGWLPKKDNEVAIKESVAQRLGYEIGDSIMIEGQGIEKKYVICGYALALFDGAYFTEEGMSRIYPALNQGIVNVYLKDDVNVEDFRELIKEKYGSSDEELMAEEESAEGSLEERIRKKAEQQMALLISQYGAKEVDYAIKIGDQMISGGTGKMRIREITSFHELVGAQLGGLSRLMKSFPGDTCESGKLTAAIKNTRIYKEWQEKTLTFPLKIGRLNVECGAGNGRDHGAAEDQEGKGGCTWNLETTMVHLYLSVPVRRFALKPGGRIPFAFGRQCCRSLREMTGR